MDFSFQWLENRGVTAPGGFQCGAARGGLKTSGDDVVLIVAEKAACCAAVFTQNRVQAAPVRICARNSQNGIARAILANAGNANCCTGAQGLENARKMAAMGAAKIGCAPDEVLICSTGIIGHPLPIEKIETALANLKLENNDEKAARAFMTTDTVPKFCAAQTEIGGKMVTVGGQCKGAGMIAPDMAAFHATMLAFLTTDAQIAPDLLQKALEQAVERSFNAVTIDGDTSTNDTALLLASGASGAQISDANFDDFAALLEAVCIALAKKIARDGEGATHLIEIRVVGAKSDADAKKIVLTIANSPLVKTAIFGGDPNWGRIAAAAGRAGVAFDARKLSFSLSEIELFRAGEPTAFELSAAEAVLKRENVEIALDLGDGTGKFTAWTCDFSYDYVKINAEYHT